MALLKILPFLFLFVIVRSEDPNPKVRVNNGILQGAWKLSTNGQKYASFMGVPYARPPVGKYRFREPQQMKPWTGVWDATESLSNCIQYDAFQDKITGKEDCLYLNIHTPKPSVDALLPVVVYIHGGAFMYGEGWLYDPSHLMDRDIVVVTFNYRLGPIGFLSTGDDAIPGNAGLKDQSFALRWVRDNIKMFGGNPDSITLTGCSAGGASVHYHYLSPLSKGTFHRGIAFSGSAFASWTYSTKPLEKARTLAAIVGCPTATTREMAECLKFRPAETIVKAQTQMFEWKVRLFTPFTPTAEGPESKEPFLTQYSYIASKNMHRVPLITSVTSEEGLYPAAAYQADPSFLPELNSKWDQLASNIFEYNDTLPISKRSSVAEKIKQYYLGGRAVGQETYPELVQVTRNNRDVTLLEGDPVSANLRHFIKAETLSVHAPNTGKNDGRLWNLDHSGFGRYEALSDRLFVADVGSLAQVHAERTHKPTYLYRYSYHAQYSLSNLIGLNSVDYGVSHGDDLMLIFKYLPYNITRTEDLQMRETLLDMVYSYAATGVPKIRNGPEWLQVQPEPAELAYLDIAGPKNIEMKTSSDFGHKKFWGGLGFNEKENYNVNTKDEL